MTQNLTYLFYFLEKESITIDQTEFEFQLQSHPSYPSLLAVADTLQFFNIENGAIHVEISEIDLLPNRFVTLLPQDQNLPQPFLIEKKGNSYFYTEGKNQTEISKKELEKKWQSVVLLVAKTETEEQQPSQKKTLLLPSLLLVAFLVVFIQFEANLSSKLFIIFPIIGLLFSIAALKDLFGAKSELISSFCNITGSTSCSSVVSSDKWKIFKHISFSDLSICFFATQFLGILTFMATKNSVLFFNMLEIVLYCSVPVIVLSLYFQKFVEKKWCPICLVIIATILSELVYVTSFFPFSTSINASSIAIVLTLSLFVIVTWSSLKKLINKLNELKGFQFKANRFIRNYTIFKNTLLSGVKVELANSPILLGNKESKTEIAIITNPFCGYCKGAHEIIEKILALHKDNLKIKILINADIDTREEEQKTLFRSLVAIYLTQGETSFLEALKNWFTNTNLKEWNAKYATICDTVKIDSYYKAQHQWCIDNNSFQTPSLFINGYRYPQMYERENLTFFVNDLIEDTDF